MLIKAAFPKLRETMRNNMKINPETAKTANWQLAEALNNIYAQLHNRQFLVGEQFSRADIAAAAFLAPLCKPKQYGLNWPQHFPEPLEAIIRQHSEKLTWVNEFYKQHR
jgi:glutathione S-transferase